MAEQLCKEERDLAAGMLALDTATLRDRQKKIGVIPTSPARKLAACDTADRAVCATAARISTVPDR